MKRRLLFGAAGSALVAAGGAYYWTNRWQHIVIHHTAGRFATIELLREVHRVRQAGDPIDAIPYHYVIGNGNGNGNGIGMGEVVATRRAQLDLWGAHVSKSKRNFFALGVCLVGNFEKDEVPRAQFDAAVKLTRSLMNTYSIPVQKVTPHGATPGEASKCPGRNFPFDAFRRAIA